MGRVCTICANPHRQEIDGALLDGVTYRSLADRFGLSETALKRHRKDHIPLKLAQAVEVATIAEAGSLLDQVKVLRDRTWSLLDKAEQAEDIRTALAAVREARACIELLLETEGELDRRSVVSVTMNEVGIRLELANLILTTLEQFPDARVAIAAALDGLSIDGGDEA